MITNWEELERECKSCKKCSLCEIRTNVVFGVGNQNSKVLFIGEGPGENQKSPG